MCDTRRIRGHEDEPGAHGDDVENAQRLVDGGVIRPLTVTLVESVEVRACDPEQQRGDKDDRFGWQSDLARRFATEDGLGEEKRGAQPEYVGQHAQPPKRPLAPAGRDGGPSNVPSGSLRLFSQLGGVL
jgi:hypothetical protein